MDVAVQWRGAPLLLADGALSAAGAGFLAREAAGERLAVVALAGARASRLERAAFSAHLLGVPRPPELELELEAAPVVVLATVGCAEDDLTVVLLDASVERRQFAPDRCEPLVAAVLAMASTVAWCEDRDAGGAGLALARSLSSVFSSGPAPAEPFLASWPPFRALFGELGRDLPAVELFELLPRSLTIDFSDDAAPAPSLLQRHSSAWSGPSSSRADAAASQLEEMVRLRNSRVVECVSADQVAEVGFLPFFRPISPIKKVFASEMTGEALHAMLYSLATQTQMRLESAGLHQDSSVMAAALDIGSAWDDLVEAKCRAAVEDAMATYVDCLHSGAREMPPMELEAFSKLHSDISRLSLDVFHSATAAYPNSNARRRAVRRQLKADIAVRYEQELEVLRSSSRAFCESVRSKLWAQLSSEASASNDNSTFDALLQAVRTFDEEYSKQACGPERHQVLRDFYRRDAVDAFEQLKRQGIERVTASHLQGMRDQLERDYEAKKEALVERFSAQEAQLRASVTREMEMIQKMHSVKLSRAKIDERESARARDTLVALERTNSELEGKVAALEQSREDAQLQRTRLERQVGELEVAVRREMASRAELVDTLAANLKVAEEKERDLHGQIASLKVELGEKTFRVEGELRDLTRHLQKTTEVSGVARPAA